MELKFQGFKRCNVLVLAFNRTICGIEIRFIEDLSLNYATFNRTICGIEIQ